jgi:outer membrane protein assembly factor BamB
MRANRSKVEAEAPTECRYYKRVSFGAATRCWGVIACLGLALPAAPQQTTTSGQVVPPPTGQTTTTGTPAQTPAAPPARGQAAPAAPAGPVAPTFAFAWRQSLGTAGPVALVASATLLVQSGGSPALVARAVDDGHELWHADRASSVTPVLGDHLVFVANDRQVVALDEASGAVRWQHEVPAPCAGLVWRAGWLLVAGEARVTAFRAADGTQLWDIAIAGRPINPPAIDGDYLFLTLADHTLVGIDITKSAVAWTLPLSVVPGPLLAANGRVYFGGSDGALHCYKQDAPRFEEWAYRARAGIVGTPVADGKHVYIGLLDNTVRALDANIGSLRWAQPFTARPMPGLALGKDVVISPLSSGELGVSTPKIGKPSGVTAFPIPPDAPSGFFHRLEATVTNPDGSQVFLVTATLEDERTLTALDRSLPAPAGRSAGPGRSGRLPGR